MFKINLLIKYTLLVFYVYYRRQKNGKLPSTFPGTVGLLVSNNNDGIVSLVNQYRRYGEGKNDEFYYFILAINLGADFKRLMKEKLISEVFSVTDEAFSLIILHKMSIMFGFRSKQMNILAGMMVLS